ncbi:unnamed protein product [Rotaria sordida]|uniref:Uncharacterized protein n=1 Tax=Rotaria sordida TaxID=392033 RepID=A0A815HC63_9BILA|nr:unnamed protein product [Rotaria sordida]
MGRRKRKSTNKHSICSVCQVSYSPSSSLIPRCYSCTSMVRNTICDSCLHSYIFTSFSQDSAKRIICPENGCHTELNKTTLHAALVKFGHQDLWEDYVLKSNWSGTSQQWMQQFAVRCPGCRIPIEKNGGCDHMILLNKMNPYVTNPFGGNPTFSYPGSFPQQGFGQFGTTGGYFTGGYPYSGGNFFSSGQPLSSPPASGFPAQAIGAQFGQGFTFPQVPSGFGYQPSSFMPQAQPSPYGAPFPQEQPSPYGAPFPQEQFSYGNPNYFGSGSYGRPRSRHSSHRRRSRPRHRRSSSSSSSSSDEHRRRGSPFGHPGNYYGNIPPRGGSPSIPPRPPGW